MRLGSRVDAMRAKQTCFFFDVCGDVGNRISMRRMQARIHVRKAGGQLTK